MADAGAWDKTENLPLFAWSGPRHIRGKDILSLYLPSPSLWLLAAHAQVLSLWELSSKVIFCSESPYWLVLLHLAKLRGGGVSPFLSLPPTGSFQLLQTLSPVPLTSVASANHSSAARAVLIPPSFTLTAKMMLMLSGRQLPKKLEKGSKLARSI